MREKRENNEVVPREAEPFLSVKTSFLFHDDFVNLFNRQAVERMKGCIPDPVDPP